MKAKQATGKYTKASPSQLSFIESMRKEGYRAEVCNGADEAIKLVEDYLSL